MSEVRPQKSEIRSQSDIRKDSTGSQMSDIRYQMAESKTERIESAKDLKIYKLAYDLAMEIFRLTKKFPSDEKYALTSQIRRSSRSICLNLREAWAKRRYEAHFVSKLTDCDGENSETDSALDFAWKCGFISEQCHRELVSLNNEVRKMLGS